MNPIGEGLASAVAILLVAAFPTVVWRWLGVLFGRDVSLDSPLLVWVRMVANAIIAAFVAQAIVLPTGALAGVPLALRLAATGIGLAAFFALRRSLVAGIVVGQLVLVAGVLALG